MGGGCVLYKVEDCYPVFRQSPPAYDFHKMAPCLEVLFCPCTSEYRENPALMNGVLDIVHTTKGSIA
jgi:hypothetical protein